jgi:hypothetical protein
MVNKIEQAKTRE